MLHVISILTSISWQGHARTPELECFSPPPSRAEHTSQFLRCMRPFFAHMKSCCRHYLPAYTFQNAERMRGPLRYMACNCWMTLVAAVVSAAPWAPVKRREFSRAFTSLIKASSFPIAPLILPPLIMAIAF